ncbi:MAG: DNA alkylation repair protein [Clostridia bacterium]|nr:DNA alkylation repair protein [Clostridia bacterium]
MDITEKLFLLRDEKYAAFQARLIPALPGGAIIGVRTPELRALAKETVKNGEAETFLRALPHVYFEENQLHAFIISLRKDFDLCLSDTSAFLPYIDNWATCDQLSPPVFGKEPVKLLPFVFEWLASERVFTVRFAIGILMRHFLGEGFSPEYPEAVAGVVTDEYYVRTMVAWYFATALAKQYEKTIPYIENRRLDRATHDLTIQKSIESFRIPNDRKAYLRTLKSNLNG